jgi:hypothetical protein
VLSDTAHVFPMESVADIPPGSYFAQAVLDMNRDLRSVNAPGNMFSAVSSVTIDHSSTIDIQMDRVIPMEVEPKQDEHLRFVKIQSRLLSQFHGRPMYLRAGIILPVGYWANHTRRYPIRVRIGGFGASYGDVRYLMAENSVFRAAWLSPQSPRFILVHLDGRGPNGDPYQVDSDNNGPYGRALTEELLPYVERLYRAIGTPRARVLDGVSTGGWAAMALQVFYPHYFNGSWSLCPDSVDFRAMQLVNIYRDRNIYVNEYGHERPAARDPQGDTTLTMRQELRLESILGHRGSFVNSAAQWGAWNAVFGPRQENGEPATLWDPLSGDINPDVAKHWRRYDLRHLIEQRWQELADTHANKLNLWAAENDEYFLNNASHLLAAFFRSAQPAFAGRVHFATRRGHCNVGLSESQLLIDMGRHVGARP